ncbi:acyl carrier protein [Algoriphagus sediminis]|uniref:Acyl carrier protein n=1 Tax=Algoriphagus sediminis TaxID=3057113 RepID=A0ABT7YAS9_9BACT|nr:acyl carrier protein [Algoriphagus sediminis]MDN3203631.1 acyl carrier protein [Algoriphagus sediminis]
MTTNYTTLKKAIEVFHSYGISLSGSRKNDHFIQTLRMDPIFVNGLIFELELELQRFIMEENVMDIQTPRELIDLLMKLPQHN